MKVRELITILESFNPNQIVVILYYSTSSGIYYRELENHNLSTDMKEYVDEYGNYYTEICAVFE